MMKLLPTNPRLLCGRNDQRDDAVTDSAVAPAPTFLPGRRPRREAGAATIEFALIALFAFIPLLLGIVELGRMFYVVTTTQEVVRRAAREQVVRWLDSSSAIQRFAVFREAGTGSVALPGSGEVYSADIHLEFYGSYADALSRSNSISGGTVETNWSNCIKNLSPCIRYVRASLQTSGGEQVMYQPMVGLFDDVLNIPLPGATLIMPAEALGLL